MIESDIVWTRCKDRERAYFILRNRCYNQNIRSVGLKISSKSKITLRMALTKILTE